MAAKKGTIQKIVETVEGAVEAAAAEIGLAPIMATPVPKTKAGRKAARKEMIARVEQQKEKEKVTRRAARRKSA